MASVRFNLQTPSAPESYVRLVFRYDGQLLVYYPGEKVKTAHWNAKAGRMRKSADSPMAEAINADLNRLAVLVEKIYRRYREASEALPPVRFRSELDKEWKNRTRPVPLSGQVLGLFEVFEQLLAERRASPNYAAGSATVYRNMINKLRRYCEARRRRLDFEHITLDFHADFTGWLNGQGFSPNYINKVVQTLKTFLGEAADRGYHSNLAFRSRRFTVRKETVEHVYLTEQEVERLAALEFEPDQTGMKRARDLFLIGCYTGLRFSDFTSIRLENVRTVDGVPLLIHQTVKTRQKVAIPILEPLMALLETYGGTAPRSMPNQKLNVHLKRLGAMAGITEPVVVIRTKGSLRVETTVPKCDLLTTHTARRSFATNEYLRAIREGRSYRPIMEILGHRKESTFFGYIKVTAEQNAVIFAAERGRKKAG